MYAIKQLCLLDWARFCELYATPMRIGVLPVDPTPEQISGMEDGLENLGSDAWAVIAAGADIKMPSAAGSGGDKVYGALSNYVDAQISKAVLGHVGSTDAVAGSLGGVDDAAQKARQTILEADEAALAATIRRDLLRPYVELNYPGQETPYIHWAVEAEEDLSERIRVDETLVRLGWVPPKSYWSDVYGRPMDEVKEVDNG